MKDDLSAILGQGNYIVGFTDGKKRVATPVTMRNLAKFLENMSMVNPNKLWVNLLFPENENALKAVLEMTFKEDNIEDLMDVIDAQNFVQIFQAILDLNGIDLPKEDDEKNEKGV